MGTKMYMIQYLLFDRVMGSRNIPGVTERNCQVFQKVFDTLPHVELQGGTDRSVKKLNKVIS